MQELITSLVCKLVPYGGNILVVGCGTGEEMIRLENTSFNYNIIGIDPSQEMLQIAKERVRSRVICSKLESFQEPTRFDCVVSVLVSHFIDSGEKKSLFYSSIAKLLRAGGIFIGADYMSIGLDDFQKEIFRKKIGKEFHPVSESEFEIILKNKGFKEPKYFFNSLGFQAYFTSLI